MGCSGSQCSRAGRSPGKTARSPESLELCQKSSSLVELLQKAPALPRGTGQIRCPPVTQRFSQPPAGCNAAKEGIGHGQRIAIRYRRVPLQARGLGTSYMNASELEVSERHSQRFTCESGIYLRERRPQQRQRARRRPGSCFSRHGIAYERAHRKPRSVWSGDPEARPLKRQVEIVALDREATETRAE